MVNEINEIDDVLSKSRAQLEGHPDGGKKNKVNDDWKAYGNDNYCMRQCFLIAKKIFIPAAVVITGLGLLCKDPVRHYMAKTALPAIMSLASKKVFVGKVLGLSVMILGWHVALVALPVIACVACRTLHAKKQVSSEEPHRYSSFSEGGHSPEAQSVML
mgnify:CR=1 FL=1